MLPADIEDVLASTQKFVDVGHRLLLVRCLIGDRRLEIGDQITIELIRNPQSAIRNLSWCVVNLLKERDRLKLALEDAPDESPHELLGLAAHGGRDVQPLDRLQRLRLEE